MKLDQESDSLFSFLLLSNSSANKHYLNCLFRKDFIKVFLKTSFQNPAIKGCKGYKGLL